MDMDLIPVNRIRDILICSIGFLVTKWLVNFRRNKSELLPPSPPGLPLIGHFMVIRRDFRDVFREFAKEYGGLFSIRFGPQKLVVINNINDIKDAFVTQGEVFSDRNMPPMLRYAIGSKGSFGFDNGPVWKARRRFGLGAMRTFGVGKHSMEQRIIEEARILCEAIENNQEVSFNPKVAITHSVANIICSISFGKRFDVNDPEFHALVSRIHRGLSTVSFFSVGNLFPYLLHTPMYTDLRDLIFSIKGMVTNVVNEHKGTVDDQHIRDIIDLYILEIRRQKERGDGVVFDEDRVWRGVFDLFGAGTGTVSATLSWGILLMASYPEVMKQVQDEIENVVGDHRPPSMSDRESMPMTMATIMEIQRFRPVAPLGIPRFTNGNAVIRGYNIPKGTAVIMNIWELMHSTKYWDEPDKFNPSRFLSDDGKSIVKPEVFIPFGIGNRVCMGELLAKMELFLILTCLLQRFTFRLPENSPADLLDGLLGISLVPDDFLITVEKRS